MSCHCLKHLVRVDGLSNQNPQANNVGIGLHQAPNGLRCNGVAATGREVIKIQISLYLFGQPVIVEKNLLPESNRK